MPSLSPTELGYLRDQKTKSAEVDWFLAVAPYGTDIFTARVNDASIERGAMEITYDNDAGESNVVVGMTLWVGSTSGAYDEGMIRIKDIDVGTNVITVAENDHIEWADDLYLTVPGEAGFFELWAKYQRLVNEGEASFEVFKDYDVDYTDQGDHLPPKANAGPPVCAWINSSGNADVDFIGVYSYAYEVGETISTYAWDFSDGAVISGGVNQAGTEAAPNTVRFTSPGFRYISLTVTDSLGTSATVYVPVWIFEEGVEDPYKKVEVLSLENGGDGWTARLKIHQTNTASEEIIHDFPDGALCVLFTRTEYGDVEIGVGGYTDRENIEFVGWLDEETLDFDYATGDVEFNAVSTDKILNQIPGFSFPLEDDDSPSSWLEIKDLNVDRALHFLFEYHTTVNTVCHVERVGEMNSRTMSQQRFPKQSIFEQANDALLVDAQCRIMTDRQGILRSRRDPQYLSAADRASEVDVVCSLTEVDWMNRVEETKRHRPKIGYVKLGGFSDDTPLLSAAPGVAPSQAVGEVHDEGYIVTGQTELNLWSGLRYTLENLDYPSIPLGLYGFWPVFDPALQEYIELTLVDPLGRVSWTNEKFIVRGVTHIQTEGTALTHIDLEHESDILTGESLEIPEIEEPDYPQPPPPPPPPNPEEPPSWDNPPQMAIAWTIDQVGWTESLVPEDGTCWPAGIYGSAGAEWIDITPVSLSGDIMDVKVIMVDDDTVAAWLLTTEKVYYTANVLSISETLANGWTEKLDITEAESQMSSGTNDTSNYFACQAIRWGSPDYLVVGITHHSRYRYSSYPAYNGAFIVTFDRGETWTIASIPSDAYVSPVTAGGGTNVIWQGDGIGVNQSTGDLIAFRHGGIDYHGKYTMCWSTDGGLNWTIDMRTLPSAGVSGQRSQYNRYGICIPCVMNPSTVYYCSKVTYTGGSFMPRISTDWGTNTTQIRPADYSRGDDLGAAQAMYSPERFCMNFNYIGGGGYVRKLLLSEDYGASYSEIGDAQTLFGGVNEGGRVESWPGNEETWVWVCMTSSGPASPQPRIVYTDDDGVTWCDVTGNWIGVFGTWSGNDCCGIRMLPRIGVNAP